MTIESDIDRVVNLFLGQFNLIYSKFYCINRNRIYYLFEFFTSSFYGAELWSNRLQNFNALQRVSVAYHKPVKKTAGKCMGQQKYCMRYCWGAYFQTSSSQVNAQFYNIRCKFK